MGPDITHWHGTYEIAKNFYTHLIPELEHLIEKGEASYDEGKQAAAKHLQATLDRILNTDNHKWYLGKMSAKQQEIRRQATESFKAQFKSK
ncbi:hypothetical protein MNB_SUP05-SYMBIONT-5-724 [hydrothermal vent metagenome]